MIPSTDLSMLRDEYQGLLRENDGNPDSHTPLDVLRDRLITDSDWSDEAADHIVNLATEEGFFILRNACALAIALRIEDGKF